MSDEENAGQIEWGEGDPRVLIVMNFILSSLFATVVIYGLSYLDLAAFTFVNVASLALILTAITYVVTK
ncbi:MULTISPECIES: hypothetical protein [Haloferax]|uniref:DUF8107 domain-containing protein n=2 Tax=Haloferax TaxID=2251 RepID=A0A6G1YZQ9_9EURY|nr:MULTISPECIES: hypothetical protein [Haloferax]KAB1187181.1 hypothetical protein Hfx1149_03685 [Haloferax sp. CBA1149]MRW79819.1 hypothetical protein [Haloferax marinisediminis]